VAIRNVEAIVETLIDTGRASKDAAFLIEAARRRLGHSICQSLVGEGGALHVLTIDPGLESQLMQGVRAGGPAPQAVALEPRLAEQFVTRLVQSAERMMKSNFLPVLLCSPELRRHVRALSERVMPHLRVLSMLEIPQAIELKSYGVVALPAP
jgi:flagellar biosynthesis protein FlhA